VLIDSRQLESGARIACDVCVIGGGAAGITLANALRGAGRQVAVLESGGLEADTDTEALSFGRGLGVIGDAYVRESRQRFLGGCTNHWGGMCAPLDAHDFEARASVPHSGWPFPKQTLDPWYERAQAICELGPYDYDVASWFESKPAPVFASPKIAARMWQMSPPTRFGVRYRSDLESRSDVRVYLWANAVNLELASAGTQIAQVDAATLSGRRFSVHAQQYVLATGAIENARLLLASNGRAPRGLGNEHDQVGRYFMDHPHHQFAESAAVGILSRPGLYHITDAFDVRGTRVRPGFGLSADVQAQEGLLNAVFTLYGHKRRFPLSDGVASLLHATGGTPSGERQGENTLVFSKIEPAPDPESRVTLGRERDSLGLAIPVVDWRLGSREASSLARTLAILARELGRTGQGRLRIADWVQEESIDWRRVGTRGGPHQMGTTRMSVDPRQGVVDADCRVHGIANLYVAGSSVFPTVGWANPTLTLVALALRLADHLRSRS
jgi:choline dehydrogenase-like flavoprotein